MRGVAVSTTIENLSPMSPAALVAPRLRLACLDDYEKIRQLALAHASDLPAREDWRRLWLDNPLRTRFANDFPIGWVLESRNGEMVGTMGTVWALYKFRGNDLVSAAGRFWFVTPPYRGFALQLMDEYFSQPVDLFVNNTVSRDAHAPFSQLSSRIPLGDWDSMAYLVTGYRGFTQRALERLRLPFTRSLSYPASAALWLRDTLSNRTLPKNAGSFTIETTDRFDARFDAFWDELVRRNPEKLLAERTSRALSWHFGAPMRKGRLWVFTACRNNKLHAYCTLTRQDNAFRLPALPHNDTQGIRAMRLVDYQCIEPEPDLLPALLAAALQRCAKEDVYILENLGRGVPKMRTFDDCAPYRRKLSNWKFYYYAADPSLHTELHAASFWDPSAYDGDASFE